MSHPKRYDCLCDMSKLRYRVMDREMRTRKIRKITGEGLSEGSKFFGKSLNSTGFGGR